MNKKPSVCICGGGNLGLVCAGMFSANGYRTSILTGHPENWSREVRVTDPSGQTFTGTLDAVGSNPVEVVPQADIVLLCVPGNLIDPTLRKIAPHLNNHAVVGSIVSSTGFFFFAHDLLPGRPLFGFQRVPYIARIEEYGRSANLLGYKPSVKVAVENHPDPEALRTVLQELFATPVELLDNFHEAALTNSNPILHTGRLYSMWGTAPVSPVATPPLFYADWTDDASQTIIDMDAEFMTLLRRIGIREGAIPTLLDYYESTDATSLTQKIRSIAAFRTIKSPMTETPQGWIPDYRSRYFTEDFNFGLYFIKILTEKYNIAAPTIVKVYNWGHTVIDNHASR